MKVTFYGAAGGVTGSKHLLEVNGKRVLLDCGMFQGNRKESLERNYHLPMELVDVDAVVLSHAHLDHCGLLPRLVKLGYKGKIFCTPATRDIAELIMSDSAHIQEQDFKWMQKEHLKLEQPAEPLYEMDDIPPTMDAFSFVPYAHETNDWTEILPGVRLKLYEAGHILGSASPVLEFDSANGPQRICFSGDLGRKNTPLLRDPDYPKDEIPTLLLESTYGNREHKTRETALGRIKKIIHEAVNNRSKIIVPAFALGRTQELVYTLHRMHDEGEIPAIPIYVDSPLASRVTQVFRNHRHDYDNDAWKDFLEKGEFPLFFDGLTYTKSTRESMDLNTKSGPMMIISAAGMCEAGRIRHHLRNNLENPNNIVMMIGFMAANTLGRKLVEGADTVNIWGTPYDVKARVEVFNEFSAHAGANELQEFAENIPGLERVFLVHGEPTQSKALEERLKSNGRKWTIRIAESEQAVAF
ncbi:MBL fold metallo-hydrolase [bacterium]|nr:MAG: MBL fold metallo-hydrolase [bacterium]